MQPRDPGFFERMGTFFSRISGSVTPRRLILSVPQLDLAGVNPVIEELGGLAGGLLYQPPSLNREDRLVSVEATASIEREYATEAFFGFESDDYVGYAYGRYRHRPEEEFYGIGSDSRPVDESVFRWTACSSADTSRIRLTALVRAEGISRAFRISSGRPFRGSTGT